MDPMNPMTRKNLPLYLFAFALTVATAWGATYAYSIGGPTGIPRRSVANGIGKLFGGVSFIALAAMYGRTALKWIILKGGSFDMPGLSDLKSFADRLLSFLNITHPYLGIVAVSSTILHCVFTDSLRDNPFLCLVLFMVFLIGLTGFLIKIPVGAPAFRKGNYVLHSRCRLGILLVFLTFVGHLLLKF